MLVLGVPPMCLPEGKILVIDIVSRHRINTKFWVLEVIPRELIIETIFSTKSILKLQERDLWKKMRKKRCWRALINNLPSQDPKLDL